MTWYVRAGNREFGPLSEQALRAIAATGQIDVKTLVRRRVTEEWVSVATVPGILPPAGRVPVPRPTPVPRPEPVLELVPDAPRPASVPPRAPALTLEGLPIPEEVDIATPWRR